MFSCFCWFCSFLVGGEEKNVCCHAVVKTRKVRLTFLSQESLQEALGITAEDSAPYPDLLHVSHGVPLAIVPRMPKRCTNCFRLEKNTPCDLSENAQTINIDQPTVSNDGKEHSLQPLLTQTRHPRQRSVLSNSCVSRHGGLLHKTLGENSLTSLNS